MRVFELMERLSKMPAGATVEFERITSVEELVKNDAIMDDDGKFYVFKTNIKEEDCPMVQLLNRFENHIKGGDNNAR